MSGSSSSLKSFGERLLGEESSGSSGSSEEHSRLLDSGVPEWVKISIHNSKPSPLGLYHKKDFSPEPIHSPPDYLTISRPKTKYEPSKWEECPPSDAFTPQTEVSSSSNDGPERRENEWAFTQQNPPNSAAGDYYDPMSLCKGSGQQPGKKFLGEDTRIPYPAQPQNLSHTPSTDSGKPSNIPPVTSTETQIQQPHNGDKPASQNSTSNSTVETIPKRLYGDTSGDDSNFGSAESSAASTGENSTMLPRMSELDDFQSSPSISETTFGSLVTFNAETAPKEQKDRLHFMPAHETKPKRLLGDKEEDDSDFGSAVSSAASTGESSTMLPKLSEIGPFDGDFQSSTFTRLPVEAPDYSKLVENRESSPTMIPASESNYESKEQCFAAFSHRQISPTVASPGIPNHGETEPKVPVFSHFPSQIEHRPTISNAREGQQAFPSEPGAGVAPTLSSIQSSGAEGPVGINTFTASGGVEHMELVPSTRNVREPVSANQESSFCVQPPSSYEKRRIVTEQMCRVEILTYDSENTNAIEFRVPIVKYCQTESEINEENPDLCDPEAVLAKAATRCNILPLYLPMFGIWDSTEKQWIVMSELLDPNNGNLELRIRFTVAAEVDQKCACRPETFGSTADKNPVMDSLVLRYLFHQIRQDFLKLYPVKTEHSEILESILPRKTGEKRDSKYDNVLVPTLFDLLRKESERGGSLPRTPLDPIKLLPRSTKEKLKSAKIIDANKFILKKRFKRIWKEFNETLSIRRPVPAECFCQKYITFVENLEVMFVNEIFPLAMEVGIVAVNGDNGVIIAVKKENLRDVLEDEFVDGEGEGLELEKKDEVAVIRIDFSQIAEMSIETMQSEFQVSMSDVLGHQLVLKFPTSSSACRFVECVNGYYNLLVDPYCGLSRQIQPRSNLEDQGMVHGPVTDKYVHSKLENDPNEFACAYRRSQTTPGDYDVIIKSKNDEGPTIGAVSIRKDSNSNFRIPSLPRAHSTMKSINDVIRSLGSEENQNLFGSNNSKALQRVIKPNRKESSLLLIKRAKVNDEQDVDNTQREEIKLTQVQRKDMGKIEDFIKKPFQILIREYFGKDRHSNATKQYVAETRAVVANRAIEHHVKDCLQDSLIDHYQVRRHLHVVRELGSTADSWRVTEYSKWGNIIEYFTKRAQFGRRGDEDQAAITGYWLLQVFYQLAHALNYLEIKNLPHGNIRGEHVLLVQVSPSPIVKLNHPGLRSTLKTQYSQKEIPTLPLPWLATELYEATKTQQKYEPTIPGDVWAFATTVSEICYVNTKGRQLENISVDKIDSPSTQKNRHKSDVRDRVLGTYVTGQISTFPKWLEYPDQCSPPPASSETVLGTLRRCWNLDPDRRPTPREILQVLAILVRHDVQGAVSVAPSSPDEYDDSKWRNAPLEVFEDKDLQTIRILGKGNYGIVTHCRHKKTGKCYAVKDMLHADPVTVEDFYNEGGAMFNTKHENLIEIKAMTMPSLRLVMDHFELGSLLYTKPGKHGGNPTLASLSQCTRHKCGFCMDIAKGMQELHRQNILHRDLALRNILLKKKDGRFIAVVSDFGLAKIAENGYYKDYQLRGLPLLWYAPECMDDGALYYSKECDIWSYGVTVWELFSSEPPHCHFPKDDIIYSKLKSGHRLPPIPMRNLHCTVVERCWRWKPEDRITVGEIIGAIETELSKMKRGCCCEMTTTPLMRDIRTEQARAAIAVTYSRTP